MIGPEHRSQTAKASHDLIRDQQDVVAVQHLLDCVPVSGGRGHDAAGAQYGFPDKGRDGVRPFGLDQRLKRVGALRGKLGFGLGAVLATIVIGGVRVDHGVHRQVEFVVEQ